MCELAGIYLYMSSSNVFKLSEFESCGLLYYTEQATEIDVVNDNQNSERGMTSKPSSADDGTLIEGSARPRTSSHFKSR